ncbi:MAG: acetyl/propionyl/methylcrotonyl-CoA carboxylase subunit alpha [Solirubrobacteraceae bacterium]
MTVLEPLLVANRGEIAVRVNRSAHALGLSTVAVFTDADRDMPHVDAADVAVRIPSYLDVAAIIDAARRSGVRSVHPGYGFLSENAEFARTVGESGLVWVGPPAEAIMAMGDKSQARRLAAGAGLPVIPGLDADGLGLAQLHAFCAEHGFPVLIKAVAGGGGKGMRVVREASELEGALAAAQREAMAAFADDRVLFERFIEHARHIEVQILADRHGNIVHLGERECSLQRRHQKVIEEAPSPALGPALRTRIGDAAVSLARACGYEGAGTVEFITNRDATEFFFLEMNTRLQVEHPVTELLYGVDLVEQQLRVAAGEPLNIERQHLTPHGHAIEARLYAEDPGRGFLPSVGTVLVYQEPVGPGVRIDTGVRAGTEVGTAYDPLLAKVICHAPDRPTAIRRLRRALADFRLVGVATNAAFARQLLAREDVCAGEQDTGLLERVLGELVADTPDDLAPAAMLAAAGTAHPPGPWRRALEGYGEARVGDGRVWIGERSWTGEIRGDCGPLAAVTLDGVQRRYTVAVCDDSVWIARDGHHLQIRTAQALRSVSGSAPGSLQAPMPGTVLLVKASNGQRVVEGEELLVIESMKMELSITAPRSGVLSGLALAVGDRVTLGQPLARILESEAAGHE